MKTVSKIKQNPEKSKEILKSNGIQKNQNRIDIKRNPEKSKHNL